MKKKIIFLSLILTILIGILIYNNLIYENNVPILAYHDVLENPISETDISIKNFEKQMRFLYKNNYKTLSLDEYLDWKNGKKIKGKKILLTFDDGKESYYNTVVPILEKYNFKSVIFVIQSAVDEPGYLTSNEILDLKNNYKNTQIESHSYNLHNADLAISKNYDIYNNDIKLNKENNYKYYAYPFGISNKNYKKALKDNNYKLAFLYSPSKWSNKNQNNYQITRVPIYRSNSLLKFILKVTIKI